MRLNFKTGRIAALAGVALAAAFAAAPARADVVGELTCNISAGTGAIIVSSRAVSCVFRSNAGPAELYQGSINRLGVDIGEVTGGTINYNVVAFGTPAPGVLAGDYVGPGFGLSLGNGGGGLNALIGGGTGNLQLQPIAATTTTGVNFNAGVGALRLAYVGPESGPVVRMHRRHVRHRHVVVVHHRRHHHM